MFYFGILGWSHMNINRGNRLRDVYYLGSLSTEINVFVTKFN